jgi:acyl-CoA synthetase (AMP-forming)/AMP-acid ligase II
LTYRELDERSNILAYGLRERGVRKGDRVAVSLGNNWEFAVLTYAIFKLGAVLVCSPFDLARDRACSWERKDKE